MDSDWEYRLAYHASVTNRLRVRAIVSQTETSRPFISTVIDTAHAGDRASEITRAATGGLWLHGVSVSIASPVSRGQAYFSLALADRGLVFALASAYVYDAFAVPDGVFKGPLSGNGLTRSIDLGDPAANVEYTTQTVPANAVWRLRGFFGTLAQGATQTPRPTIVITDGTVSVLHLVARVLQASSVTTDWSIMQGGSQGDTAAVNAEKQQILGSYSDVNLLAGYEITWVTEGKGANTNWGDGQLLVEEWIEP